MPSTFVCLVFLSSGLYAYLLSVQDRPLEKHDVEQVKIEVQPEFEQIFAKFSLPDDQGANNGAGLPDGKGEVIYSDDDMMDEEDEQNLYDLQNPTATSKRKAKKANRLSVAELKRLVKKPEVVEWTDVTATDPKMLVQLKSTKNTVPVPGHWAQKRDYLAGKKGIEKPLYQLPSFIADTGIATQRDTIKEKEEQQSLKQKTRERVQPKMGKIDIDYQKLHDAFFRYQTKPPLTQFGELYYEGKEFETKLKEKRPGDLSDELKEALSIPPLAPPPWLISMQRYGPPPSYPNLKIPGLNAPIPEGAAWGFHPGGWGKPPIDEYGRPLYGDVYGVAPKNEFEEQDAMVDRTPWGELEPDLEESEEEEEESSDEEDEDDDRERIADASGLETPSGFESVASTVPGGLETPDHIELRKRREQTDDHDEDEDDGSRGPKSLYTVLPERESRIRGFMGSDRVYDVSALQGDSAPVLGKEERGTKRKADGVQVALDAADLEGLSEAELRAKYDSASRARSGAQEDFSDMVSEEAAKRRRKADETKRRRQEQEKEKFKF